MLFSFNRFKYFFVFVDKLSRACFAFSARTKKANVAGQALEKLIELIKPNKIKTIRSDRGTEFGSGFQSVVKKNNIRHYFAWGKHKAAFAEVYGKLIKTKFYRYKEQTGDRNWPSVLAKICQSLNTKHLDSIGMPPDSVTVFNAPEVYLKLFKPFLDKKSKDKLKFKVGDPVLIQIEKTEGISKGYYQSFSTEIFYVSRTLERSPRMKYFLQDKSGFPLPRSYYFEELRSVLESPPLQEGDSKDVSASG
jgi:hypothetical protein